MVCFNRILGCSLVGVLGLVFSFESSAQYANPAARLSCLNRAEAVLTAPNVVSASFSKECVSQANPPYPGLGYALEGTVTFANGSTVPHWQVATGTPVQPNVSVYTIGSTSGRWYTGSEQPPEPPTCQAGVEVNGWRAGTLNGTGDTCINGCVVSIGISIGGTGLYSGDQTGATCSPGDFPPAVPANPNPNENPCEDGSVTCPGTGGDPEAPPGTGGGGFTCDVPPVCNSDGVTCSMLFQQWRGRCQAQYDAAVAQQKADLTNDKLDTTNSTLSTINDTLGTGFDSMGNKIDGVRSDMNDNADRTVNAQNNTTNAVQGLRSDLEGLTSDGGLSEPSDGDWGSLSKTVTLGTDGLDDTGMGFPRQCPMWSDISFTVGASAIVIPLSTFTLHCTIFEWTGILLLAFASYYALRIVISGD